MNRRTACCALALLTSVFATATPAKTLRWKLAPEAKFRIVANWSTRHLTGGSEVTNVATCDTVWVIKSVDPDGNVNVSQTLAHVKQNLQAPDGETFQYDSQDAGETKGTAGFMATYWKPLLAGERTFKLTPSGQIVVSEQATKPGTQENVFLGRSFGQEGWRDALRNETVVLPEGELKIDQKWTESQAVPLAFDGSKLKVTRTYSYSGEQKAEPSAETPESVLDLIQLTTRFEIEPDAKKENPKQLKIVQQNGTGEILFDAAAGHPVSSKYSQSVTLRLADGDQGIESQMTTSYEMTFQLLPQVEATAAGEPAPK